MTNTNKIQAVAQIVMAGALETLAKTHSSTVDAVREAILAGHAKLNEQFKELVQIGLDQAIKMHNNNEINIA